MRQPTPLWRKAFLSELQEEKSIAQQSSQEKLSQPSSAGDDSSNKVGPSTVLADDGYHPRGHSASIASTTATCKSSIAGEREEDNFHTRNVSKTRSNSAEILSTKQPHTSTAKMKGRLGHLVAAIAQAHHSSQKSSTPSTHLVNGSISGEPSRPKVLHHPSNAWVTTSDKSLESVDLISEMYMCSKCDRMYTDRGELEQHQSLCQS